jgi:hypothetical protein
MLNATRSNRQLELLVMPKDFKCTTDGRNTTTDTLKMYSTN